MFTGIVQGKAKITDISGGDELKTFNITFPPLALSEISRGASIAINGTCLTVTEYNISENIASFDVMHETLSKTNLNALVPGDLVNFERAAKIGDEIGGHLMSGHIHDTVIVRFVEQSDDVCTIHFKTPPHLQMYLLPKGFVGLNGCSLTIGESVTDTFCVHLIPETLNVTTFGSIQSGDEINIEIDPQTQAIVDTVRKVLANSSSQ